MTLSEVSEATNFRGAVLMVSAIAVAGSGIWGASTCLRAFSRRNGMQEPLLVNAC
jgi:hypothetical protein